MSNHATEIRYVTGDANFDCSGFLRLAQRVWPGDYDDTLVSAALTKTLNIGAWHGERLVGSLRVLTDGYFFSTVPELLVDPEYRGRGIATRLMELAWEASPTSLFFGAQPGRESFYEALGYEPSLASFARRKPRPQSTPVGQATLRPPPEKTNT